MRTLLLICLLIPTLDNRVAADDKPIPRPISELRIQKVGLETTRQEFLKLHPKAVQSESDDDQFGIKIYALLDDEGITIFSFLDDKLHYVRTVWAQKNIARNDGWMPVVKKIEAKYGKADVDSPKTDAKKPFLYVLKWLRDDCLVTADLQEHEFGLSLTSIKQYKKLEKLKAKPLTNRIDD